MAKKKKADSFEALLAAAEEIVDALEVGDLPLDEALAKYEKGITNLRTCGELLDQAEKRVKVLVETVGGKLALDDFAAASAGEIGDDEDADADND